MNEQIHEKLKEIKQSFRLLMNGVASHSMRQKGVTYKINWGVPIPDLQKMAAEYGKDYELAIELWKEDIRECQVLATLIMPAEKMDEEDELSADARVRTVSISNDCFSSGDGSFILVGTRSIACVLSCVNSTVLIYFRCFTKLYS